MAQVQSRKINGDLSFNADLVYATLKVAKYSQGLAYTATSGWNSAGTLSVAADQSFQVGVETEAVDTGTPITTKDDLVSRLTGEAQFTITDINPLSGKWSMGTTNDIIWDTSGTTWTGTVLGTTGGVNSIYVSTATGVSVKDVLKVPLSTSGNIFYWPGIVDNVDTTAGIITWKYPLPEAPATSAVAERVRGYDLYHGGNVLQNMAVLVQLDFPKGDQHILEIPKCSATGGFTRQLSGAVKTPMNLKMYGTLRDVGTLTDQVTCAITHVGFPNR